MLQEATACYRLTWSAMGCYGLLWHAMGLGDLLWHAMGKNQTLLMAGQNWLYKTAGWHVRLYNLYIPTEIQALDEQDLQIPPPFAGYGEPLVSETSKTWLIS